MRTDHRKDNARIIWCFRSLSQNRNHHHHHRNAGSAEEEGLVFLQAAVEDQEGEEVLVRGLLAEPPPRLATDLLGPY